MTCDNLGTRVPWLSRAILFFYVRDHWWDTPFVKAATDTGSAEYEERPWKSPGL